MAGGAEAGVVDFFDAGFAELPFDARPQIHIVMTGTDARANEGEAIRGAPRHGSDGLTDDVGKRSLFAGVNERNGGHILIHDKDRRAVGAADDERQAGLPGDEGINTRKG